VCRTELKERPLQNKGQPPSFEPKPRRFKDLGRTTMVLSEPLLAALRRLDSAYRAEKTGWSHRQMVSWVKNCPGVKFWI